MPPFPFISHLYHVLFFHIPTCSPLHILFFSSNIYNIFPSFVSLCISVKYPLYITALDECPFPINSAIYTPRFFGIFDKHISLIDTICGLSE